MQTFDETMQADVQAKPGVMAAQQQLLERRYELTPRFDPAYSHVPGEADRRSARRRDWGQGTAGRAWRR